MINVDTGEQLREVTEADELLIFETLQDWNFEGGRDSRSRVARSIQSSIDNFSVSDFDLTPIPQIKYAITVMQDSTGEFVGFCDWSFYPGDASGFDIHRLAIHPSKRGLGHFPTFSDGIAYIANQILQADGAHFSYYAEVEVEGVPVGRDDRELKERILKGEVPAVEQDSTLKTMREKMGGIVLQDSGVKEIDGRLSPVELERTEVETRLFAGRSKFSRT